MKTSQFFKKMRLFTVITILFFPKLLSATEEVDFNYDTSDSYRASIQRLRESISRPAEHVNDLRMLPAQQSQKFTILNLSNGSGGIIKLVLLNNNLYIVGFISRRIFYRFADSEFNEITIPGYRTMPLPIASSYTSLERVAERSLSEVEVSQVLLSSSVSTLFNYSSDGKHKEKNKDKEMSRAMLRFIVSISEAIRFHPISNRIAGNIKQNTTFQMRRAARLVRNWGSMSEYANTLEYYPQSSHDYFEATTSKIFTREGKTALTLLLAVAAYCKPPVNMIAFICPFNNQSENVLINNTYLPKVVLVSVFD